jgi:hypothetical protein
VRLPYSEGREFLTIAAVLMDEPEQENEFVIKIQVYHYVRILYKWACAFRKGPDGAVTHLTVSHPRLMYHRFDKVK